jgi:hypothetical protein
VLQATAIAQTAVSQPVRTLDLLFEGYHRLIRGVVAHSARDFFLRLRSSARKARPRARLDKPFTLDLLEDALARALKRA